ncbi:MAG: ABC transporter permease, partial [Planctomycetes bacterium]|nr:ABC transporter permease [Planctomycetota bacterium]
LGAELLARPSLLYIDEATSGLDAGTEARMMHLFRTLADEGKSLICITHNIENVDRCHLIIVLARGKMICYGPPAEAVKYFAVPKLSAIYDRIQEREVEVWEKEFAGSSLYQEFVAKRLTPAGPPGIEPAAPVLTPSASEGIAGPLPPAMDASSAPAELSAPPASQSATNVSSSSLPLIEDVTPPPRPQNTPSWHQFNVLTLRYIELIWTDRRSLYMLLLQAPLVALFVLAGFIGKPYQQKIPVPHISEEEYLALNMLQAFVHDMKAAEVIDNPEVRKAVSKLKFTVHSENPQDGSTELDHQELVRRLKEQRDKSATKDALGKVFVTMHANEGKANEKKMTLSLDKILEKPSNVDSSKITGQLIAAHEIANVTNPRFTYILLFLVSIIVLWSGCNNAAKEIVKEEAIYARERAVNLAIWPYVASKFIVMSVLTIFQTMLLMGMVYGTLHALHAIKPSFIEHSELPAAEYMLPYGPQFFFLSLLAMAGVALGLLLSACVSSPDRANALLPYVLIPQIILGGGIMPIKHGVLEWLAWLLSPEYWAFRAIRLGETKLPSLMEDNRMVYDDTLWLPCVVLLAETLVLLIATAWFLRRKDEN